MLSSFVRNRFFPLAIGCALAFCLAATPAHAKKHAGNDSSENGGLFQPPTAIAKPNLIIDTSSPKVSSRKGDAMRQTVPDAAMTTPAVASGSDRQPPNGVAPVKAYDPTRTIESMRLHSLFE